ncbi:MAG: FAD-binding protein [Gemmatimonadetes bacterium]|nr:FAD-binding protein [Gemmatimonadota bacterium]
MTYQPASTSELAALLTEAHGGATPLRIVARGTWPEATRTVRADARPLDISRIAGIVEYVPGDLTLTARAGTTIVEIDDATAAHGQWCPLLPWGGDDGTLGATMATATTGPCAAALGTPRDLALGLEFVDGAGNVARGGGRVVKNVAGFDLTRLLVGSWGTLGVITELSVRLRARPPVDETWCLTLDPNDDAVRARLDGFRRGPYAPLSCELVHGAAARAAGLAHDGALVRLGGNRAFVAASLAALRTVGDASPHDPAIWARVRALHAAPALDSLAHALDRPLEQRVKALFDPRRILNPGLFGEAA